MKIRFLVFLLLLNSSFAIAQNKHTISGYIRDSLNGETLIGATVTVRGQSKGISSNQYGFYSITLDDGKYTLLCSFVGYRNKLLEIDLRADTKFNFEVLPNMATSQEVVITTKKRDVNVKNAQMGKITLPIEQIKSIPAFLGEVDLLKTVQLLPGVRNAGEGSY